MISDAELLRRYVESRSEEAFAELVQRHLNLVYFAALRQVGGDAHRAKDVAQAVFTDLARKASSLTDRGTLTGWLHTSTRFGAAKARRADLSRQHYELEAMTMNALLPDSEPAAEWERLRPMIDDVIHELDDRDREAVLLRYFEDRPFAEIGATLRLTEDAARMRVDRALDKLRAMLARRGVTSTGAALATAFANQVGVSAPVGLANAIAGMALAGAAPSNVAIVSAGIFMSKTTTVIGAVALVAIGSTFFQWNHAQRAEADLAVIAVDRDGLRAELQIEQQRNTRSVRDIAALQNELTMLKAKPAATSQPVKPMPTAPVTSDLSPTSPDPAAMGIMQNLMQIDAAVSQFTLEKGRPPNSLDELVGEGKIIRRLVPVAEESYTELSFQQGQTLVARLSNGQAVTYTPISGRELGKIIGTLQQARVAYSAATNGQRPPNDEALLPYFATQEEAADYVVYREKQKASQKAASRK